MAYTYKTTPDGNVEVYNNGTLTSTTSAQNAQNTYGYTAPTAATQKTTVSPYYSSADGQKIVEQTQQQAQRLTGTPAPAPTTQQSQQPQEQEQKGFSFDEAVQLFGTDFTGVQQNKNGTYTPDSSALSRLGINNTSSVSGNPQMAQAQSQLQTAKSQLSTAVQALNTLNVTNDPQLQQILASVTSGWDARIGEAANALESNVKDITQTGIRLGSRYTGGAGGTTGSLVSAAEINKAQKLAQLEQQKQSALLDARTAFENKKWDQYYKQVGIAQQTYENQLSEIKGLQEAQAAQDKVLADERKSVADAQKAEADQYYKEVEKPIQDVLFAATKGGAPKDVIDAINNSQDVGEALKNAGSYLQDIPTSGIVGEYLFYKKQAEAAGQVPLDFNGYQDVDANRKRSIAAAGASVANSSGLNPKQVTIFNSLVDKQNKSPLIAANDRAVILRDVADSLKADPSNASLQVSFIYSMIQALDTYQSAVREGEIGLISSTQGLGDKLANLPDKILKGSPLSAAKVNEYISTSKILTDSINSAAQKKRDTFSAQARVSGVGEAFDEYQTAVSDIQPVHKEAAQSEEQARSAVIDFSTKNADAREQISKLAGVVQPSLGRAYTWAEIKQIIGA